MSPRVFLLIGPPGSGKSTWRARHLAENAHRTTVVVSSDDLIDEYAVANSITYTEAFKLVDQKWVDGEIRRRFAAALAEGHDVVVDRTNMTAKGRASFLSTVPGRYQKIAVVFDVPRDELDRRLLERANATGKHIPAFVVNSMLASYQAPELGEFHEIRAA